MITDEHLSNINSEALKLIDIFFKKLSLVNTHKLSTDDFSRERLWWEVNNKIFSILVSNENCIHTKDSLSAHLINRYTYELLIVISYIFINPEHVDERVMTFLSFNQFRDKGRCWSSKNYSEMVQEVEKYSTVLSHHKSHYRSLSNFAHPTMDSFLLNRRGPDVEKILIAGSAVLCLAYIIELLKLSFSTSSYFTDDEIQMVDISHLDTITFALSKRISGLDIV